MATARPQRAETSWKSDARQHYQAFVDRLSPKGRETMVRHDEQSDAQPARGDGALWKRLAGGLSHLAPHAPELEGRQSVKFYIPDGKYRQQVFALEDMPDGAIAVYMPDVLARAMDRKILARGTADTPLKVLGHATAQIQLDVITADTPDITVCKAMVSWGKRALRTRLVAPVTEESVHIVERLCELAAEAWAQAASAPAAAAKSA